VIEPVQMGFSEFNAYVGPDEDTGAAMELLNAYTAPSPRVTIEHRLLEGSAATVITETASETGADMIVMGTHGRTGLSRLMMGSVAEEVLRRAPCPVLTIRAMPVKALEPTAAVVAAG
jgi:nucleotide-binding universal stress UspA family protein